MLADLQPGDVVLDLGSDGGIDVLLSARRVGPTGKAYGLDMTPEMLDLARKNQIEAGVTNVEFRVDEDDDIVALAGELSVDVELPGDIDRDKIRTELGGSIMSAFVRGTKPA